MFKKPVVRWLSLLLIVIAVIGIMVVSAEEPAPKAVGLVLEDMPIVLPANATEVEKTAAKELQHYLKRNHRFRIFHGHGRRQPGIRHLSRCDKIC